MIVRDRPYRVQHDRRTRIVELEVFLHMLSGGQTHTVIKADGPLLFSFLLLLRLLYDLLETGSPLGTYVVLWRVGRWMGRQ